MSYPVDPMKAKYYPELFGEAGMIATTVDGAEIASYNNFSENIVQLMNLGTFATDQNSMIRVSADSGGNLVDEKVAARQQIDSAAELKITGKESMLIEGYYPAGTATGDLFYRYGLRVTKPTVFEKLMSGTTFDIPGNAQSARFDIAQKISAGVLSGRAEESYIKVYEVAKSLTITSGTNGNVGPIVHPLADQKVVLLGVSCEQHGTAAQVYLSVTRDEEQVMKLDTHAFVQSLGSIDGSAVAAGVNGNYGVSMNYEMPLHVVATDKLRVWIENPGSAVTTFKVRFRYGVAPLTLMDRIRWNLGLNDDQMAVANELDLFDSVKAGVL